MAVCVRPFDRPLRRSSGRRQGERVGATLRGAKGEWWSAQVPSTGSFDVAQDGLRANGLRVKALADLRLEVVCVRPFDVAQDGVRVTGLGATLWGTWGEWWSAQGPSTGSFEVAQDAVRVNGLGVGALGCFMST